MQKLELYMNALQEKIAHKKAFLEQRTASTHGAPTSDQSGAEGEAFDLETGLSLNERAEKESIYGEN